ncbi:SH3 domain-containing protein [Streptomyces sp. PTM05]|uniref:SH3 domain-containing protein n=1 Tax=Streptantibioticus parmotrematis TaxID=2873249 RepID=A0ABS7QU77_9ACTN|nr:SH3 domain-containing protein [Streptantibioticus parmotrematis]MBY8886745.1 SH3 domain-containing protein [Streptantibioticus parmotrematis]
MVLQSKLSKVALAAAAGTMIAGTVAGTAVAADNAWGPYKGRVIANGGLFVRERPTTNSRVVGWHAKGSVVGIKCKVNGQNVNGNPRWYKLTDGTYGWSAARYIVNIGPAPRWC